MLLKLYFILAEIWTQGPKQLCPMLQYLYSNIAYTPRKTFCHKSPFILSRDIKNSVVALEQLIPILQNQLFNCRTFGSQLLNMDINRN